MINDFFIQAQGTPMYIAFLAILLVALTVLIVWNFLETKKQLKQSAPVTEKEKCKGFLEGAALLWGAVAVVFIMCFVGGISLADIGFRPIKLNHGVWFSAIMLSVSGVFLGYILFGMISVLRSAKERTASLKEMPDSVKMYLPATQKEKWLFAFLAFSAGVCEEILFRGFVAFLFWAIFPAAPVWVIIALSSLIFGIGHLYQGLKGVAATTLLGIFFICTYLATDSLIIPIILHFLNDLIATFLYKKDDMEIAQS